MNKAKHNKIKNILFAAIMFALFPVIVSAQTTVSGSSANTGSAPATVSVPEGFAGIFSCNQNGAESMSVGALGATGGVYVPVADATVELNSGTLVYKECILREVVDAERQAATAGFAQQDISQIQNGRNGAPQYVVNPIQDELTADNAIVTDDLQSTLLDPLDPPTLEQAVKSAIAQGYSIATQNRGSQLACPYQGSTADFTNSDPSGNIFNDILAVATDCNPIFAYDDANEMVQSDVAEGNSVLGQEWQEGAGLYPVTTGGGSSGANPLTQKIVTPSSLVNSSFTQVVNSSFNQLQNANDLGQMVGALFAGISTELTSQNNGGLAGITQPIGNQPSYLAQAIAQTTQNLQSSVQNAGLANLDAALQLEQSYYSIMTSIQNTLAGAVSELRGAEGQCWQQIISNVCAGTPTANSSGHYSCQDANGDTLKIATSTAFSAAAIANSSPSITALASTTANNLAVSQQALNLINNLIQSVSSSDADTQSVAIEQLNNLIVNHELHTQADITTAQSQQTSVQNSVSTFVQNTASIWAGTDPNNSSSTDLPWDGSTSPGTGWCDIQNQTTIQMWIQKWSS